MDYADYEKVCPKCDFGRYQQNSDQCISVDIAHNQQTVAQATQAFYEALAQAKRENYGELRLIVGGGLINKRVGQLLEAERHKKQINQFDHEAFNKGAYLVKL